MPHESTGKDWKLARPYLDPYRILRVTPTNAEVYLADKPSDSSILICLVLLRYVLNFLEWPLTTRADRATTCPLPLQLFVQTMLRRSRAKVTQTLCVCSHFHVLLRFSWEGGISLL